LPNTTCWNNKKERGIKKFLRFETWKTGNEEITCQNGWVCTLTWIQRITR
jgi:hypothetical protein